MAAGQAMLHSREAVASSYSGKVSARIDNYYILLRGDNTMTDAVDARPTLRRPGRKANWETSRAARFTVR